MKVEKAFDRISHAITCRSGKNLSHSIFPTVGVPDYERAFFQHQDYCEALKKCGVSVTAIAADPQFPDRWSVGSMAVVTDYLAVIANFDNQNPRQGEQKDIASALAGGKFLKFITPPGQLDATDVLQIRDHFYIGLSERTNQEGAAQLAYFLKEYGYEVTMLPPLSTDNDIRPNTAATYLGRGRLLIRAELARHYAFLEYEKIVVPYQERGAANALMVNGTLLMPAGYTETLAKVQKLGTPVVEVNISEFEKMNASMGSLSLRLPKIDNVGLVKIADKIGAVA